MVCLCMLCYESHLTQLCFSVRLQVSS
jgi:hypothetical protein